MGVDRLSCLLLHRESFLDDIAGLTSILHRIVNDGLAEDIGVLYIHLIERYRPLRAKQSVCEMFTYQACC